MSKRFTDTDKWKKSWFNELSLKMKLVWIYLCDNCDHAGIWDIDINLLSFSIGQRVTVEEIAQSLHKHVQTHSDKLFIRSFYDFQYGSTKNTFQAKCSAIKRLQALGFMDENGKIEEIQKDSPPTVGGQSLDSPSISIGKSISIIKEGIHKGNKVLENLYAAYPRKQGKSRGMAKLKTQIKNDQDYSDFMMAVENYRAYCSKNALEARYVKHFDTFVGEWRDWLSLDIGHSEAFKRQSLDFSVLKKKDDL